MENYPMNRFGQRPYNRTCGMMNSPCQKPGQRVDPSVCESSSRRMESAACEKEGRCVDASTCVNKSRNTNPAACGNASQRMDPSTCVNASRNTNPAVCGNAGRRMDLPVREASGQCINSSACAGSCQTSRDDMYMHLKHLVPAMAYVPYQQFTSAYDLKYALDVGTIFPQLCKPFCGKRGARK